MVSLKDDLGEIMDTLFKCNAKRGLSINNISQSAQAWDTWRQSIDQMLNSCYFSKSMINDLAQTFEVPARVLKKQSCRALREYLEAAQWPRLLAWAEPGEQCIFLEKSSPSSPFGRHRSLQRNPIRQTYAYTLRQSQRVRLALCGPADGSLANGFVLVLMRNERGIWCLTPELNRTLDHYGDIWPRTGQATHAEPPLGRHALLLILTQDPWLDGRLCQALPQREPWPSDQPHPALDHIEYHLSDGRHKAQSRVYYLDFWIDADVSTQAAALHY